MKLATIVAAGLLTVLAAEVDAQSASSVAPRVEVTAGAGWGSLWDDETLLGRGVALNGGVGWLLGNRIRLSGDVDWLGHSRDAGYLAADGNLISVFGSGSYLFGARSSTVRAVAGAGIGVMHSSGTLTTHSLIPGPNGLPAPGPDTARPWTTTQPAFDLHGGVRIAMHPRAVLGPEMRWRASFGSGGGSSIEPPLLNIQALVNVDLRVW